MAILLSFAGEKKKGYEYFLITTLPFDKHLIGTLVLLFAVLQTALWPVKYNTFASYHFLDTDFAQV